MRASFYERTGPAREVLPLGELTDPEPGPGEVRIRVAYSGVNPSDFKSRAGLRSKALPFPGVVPHSDGSGRIDRVGDGVDPARVGQRVWVWKAAWGREVGEEAAAKEVRAALARAREACGKQRQWQALGEWAACPPKARLPGTAGGHASVVREILR